MAEVSILMVCESLSSVLPVLRAYCEGSDPAQLELVLVVVGDAHVDVSALHALGFGAVRIVNGGDDDIGTAEARALRAASSPWVVFAQAHARPRPGFARVMTAAGRSNGWAMVGPAIAEGSPDCVWSRVYNRICNTAWIHDPAPGPVGNVPGHNSLIERAALVALGPRADEMLDAGWGLVLALLAAGGRAGIEPRGCIEIRGPQSLSSVAVRLFRLGRRSAGDRCRSWPRWRRWVYAAGSPLIPIVRAARIAADDRRHGQRAWALWPLVLPGLAVSATGEACGFLFGPGPPNRLEWYRDVLPP